MYQTRVSRKTPRSYKKRKKYFLCKLFYPSFPFANWMWISIIKEISFKNALKVKE